MAGLFSLLGGLGSIAGGLEIADDMRKTGSAAAAQMGDMAAQLQDDTAFRGYGVTTGLGTSTVRADGSTDFGVGPDQGMMDASGNYMNASQQAMQNAMMDRGAREQEIYNAAMAMQNPMLDAQQAAQQAREYAQGRGGIRGSQFGGTAEDAAMARARAQAANAAAFQAMGQGQTEMLNQAQMANQFGALGQNAYNTSFLPMQQQLNMMQVGQNNANMAQTGQITGANLGAQLGLGGIQSQVNSDMAAANLYTGLFGAGMGALGGLGNAGEGFFETIGSWFG
jgi:hypothetical protein